MKLHIVCLLLLAITLIFGFSAGCLSTINSPHKIIIGNELEEYRNINTYIEGDLSDFIMQSGSNQGQHLVYYRYDAPIKIEILVSENSILSASTIQINIEQIFELASAHLLNYFTDIVVNRDLYIRILACCIEYGMRRKNTKYYELGENINCITKLGLDGSEKDPNWASTDWSTERVFQIFM